MECRMCGFEFDETQSCSKCGKHCPSTVHCPNCGYGNTTDYEEEFEFVKKLKDKIKNLF